MGELETKIDLIISVLNDKFSSIEKKVDTIEAEIKCMRVEASRNSERITRLEEAIKNHDKDLARIEKSYADGIEPLCININNRVDKKLARQKVAIFTALAGAVLAVAGLAVQVWGKIK